MKLLLDTCVLIWIFEGSSRIGADLRTTLTDPANQVFASDINLFEIVIKYQLRKFPLPRPPSEIIPPLIRRHRLEQLPISAEAIFGLETLPPLHRDPFDRLLIAQALATGCSLVTPDPLIRQYDVPSVW